MSKSEICRYTSAELLELLNAGAIALGKKEFPKDAEITGCGWHLQRCMVEVVVRSEDFEEVDQGDLLPVRSH